MGGNIDADTVLDYASFQILPSDNRYEAYVCSDDKVEKLAEGSLEQLLPHVPEVNGLCGRGSNSIYKLQLPEDLCGALWFTKTTLNRFLCIVHSSEFMHTFNSTKDEMSQLEEARDFHLSLYTQPKADTASSDSSKNELLRAMELRLSALKTELSAAFNQATGGTFSSKELVDLAAFLDFTGARDLKNCLSKIFDTLKKSGATDSISDVKSSNICNLRNVNTYKTEGNTQLPKPSHSVTPVKYGASPAKAAEVERLSSTESEQSSASSDEDQTPAERSRTHVRSATPRRSASPMRRIQIGRTGPRRPAALTIKSLGYIPPREKAPFYRDEAATDSETEGSEPSKKPSNDIRRMSVQDAINLFERKQRDQFSDIHKSQNQVSGSTNKSVLRRWSAGVARPSENVTDTVSKDSLSLTPDVTVNTEEEKGTEKEKLDSDFVSGVHDHGDGEVDGNLLSSSDKLENQADIKIPQAMENSERPVPSAEWHQQKEAELNQMLMKMMESNPIRSKKPHNSSNKDTSSEQRGGFYDHYKEKRDKRIRENAGKVTEKKAQFKTIRKSLDENKAKKTSENVSEVGKKHIQSNLQKPRKSPSQIANLKKESPKPSSTKKLPSKTSSLPATRKSWPSTPSPRTTGVSPAKTSGRIPSAVTTTRQKTPAAPMLTRSSPKVEKSPQQRRTVKEMQTDVGNTVNGVTEKRQQAVTKSGKTTKAKTNPGRTSADSSGLIPTKPKMTKKSSVVPLESKPFLRKGSKVGTGPSPVTTKKKTALQPEESQKDCVNLIEAQESEVVVDVSKTDSEQQKGNSVSQDLLDAAIEPQGQVTDNLKSGETDNSGEVVDNGDGSINREDCSSRIQAEEESVISPRAWVEIEEHQEIPSPHDNNMSKLASSDNVVEVGMSSPRVRHSLSQMLQEENSEPDTNEWGNAENPPAIVYQRDAPKGLKRLLKFARRSKGESNTSGLSSPSVFSEGEDDTEESKAVNKRSYENLLRKAALNAKNYGTQKNSINEGYEANLDSHGFASGQSSISSHDSQSSSNKQQGSRSSSTIQTTKGTKSFFSLSAFRGSKPNETKLR